VLVQGFGDLAETWALMLPRLKRKWRILAPDLAGSVGLRSLLSPSRRPSFHDDAQPTYVVR
jgi:hypothetical protein